MYFPGAASLLMMCDGEVSVSPCSYLIPPLQISSPLEEGRSSESASPIPVIWMAEMGWSRETYLMTMMRVTMAFLPWALFATT